MVIEICLSPFFLPELEHFFIRKDINNPENLTRYPWIWAKAASFGMSWVVVMDFCMAVEADSNGIINCVRSIFFFRYDMVDLHSNATISVANTASSVAFN